MDLKEYYLYILCLKLRLEQELMTQYMNNNITKINLKNQNCICDVCKCEGNITNKSRHLKTKKHMNLCKGVSPSEARLNNSVGVVSNNTEEFFDKLD